MSMTSQLRCKRLLTNQTAQQKSPGPELLPCSGCRTKVRPTLQEMYMILLESERERGANVNFNWGIYTQWHICEVQYINYVINQITSNPCILTDFTSKIQVIHKHYSKEYIHYQFVGICSALGSPFLLKRIRLIKDRQNSLFPFNKQRTC